MAAGWYRLSTAIVAVPLYSVLSAALFVALNDRCQLAGEWVVGGIEAKEFAYALIFFAFASLLRGRWTWAWLLLGASAAFHVLVGGWAIVAAGFLWLRCGSDRPRVLPTLLALAAAFVLCLPGLLPALWLTTHAAPETVATANAIYVYERLGHHLVFTSFPGWDMASFASLAGLWGLLCWIGPNGLAWRRLNLLIVGSLLIAAIGIVISFAAKIQPELAAKLLRFYWFRLADAMLPLGTALAATGFIAAARARRAPGSAAWLLLAIVVAGAHLGNVLYMRFTYPAPRTDWALEDAVDDPVAWWSICDWVVDNTPADAVFITPRMASTFRWYTGRAEVASWKDMPQDAAGLVAWRQRMEDLYWRPAHADQPAKWRRNFFSDEAKLLEELGRRYGADYVITAADPPLPLEKVSPAGERYAVYRLR